MTRFAFIASRAVAIAAETRFASGANERFRTKQAVPTNQGLGKTSGKQESHEVGCVLTRTLEAIRVGSYAWKAMFVLRRCEHG